MADSKISALSSLSPVTATDVLPVVDHLTTTTKKVSVGELFLYPCPVYLSASLRLMADGSGRLIAQFDDGSLAWAKTIVLGDPSL